MNAANTGCPEGARTVAWAYGEAGDEALDHIARCEECTALVDDLERVEGAIASVRPSLARSRPKSASLAPSRAALLFAATLAAAAMVALWVGRPAAPEREERPISANIAFQDDLDDRLDDLDASLDGLDDDLL